MMKWEIAFKGKTDSSNLINVLLKNREIGEKEKKDFITPDLKKITPLSVGIDISEIKKSVDRINKAVKNNEQIIVFGDYDVDGICGSAILWETLNKKGAKILPYIPNRIEEGYGLSIKGIENLFKEKKGTKLIVTTDNGIVANQAVDFARSLGIDVIITDHHAPSKTLPKAFSIVHTVNLCGAGVAYMLSREFKKQDEDDDHLGLVALATVSDLVPLKSANRALLKFGLEKLRTTKRPGLLALFNEAGINKKEIGVYEIGHIIAPRLNAMGRLESAMESLRLICTKNSVRAKDLAFLLSSTNKERQDVTEKTVMDAKDYVRSQKNKGNLLFVSNSAYQQGVIGLVAGRLVEEFYLPSIVISQGEKYSKASARSISGFNIIEFIRSASDLLVDAGGHPMAAGFTVETEKIKDLREKLEADAEKLINQEMKKRIIKVDCVLELSEVNFGLYNELEKLSPFGMGNPQPVFLVSKVKIENLKYVGNGNKHLKLTLSKDGKTFDAIFFSVGERTIKTGSLIDIVYLIDINEWNGSRKLQLKIRDIKE